MLFDLEDYATSGFFGNPNGQYVYTDAQGWHFDGIAIPPVAGKQHSPYHWEDAETTFRATRDAYMKATNEYILSGLYFSAVSEKPAILAAELDIYTKYKAFLPISKNFWNALKSLAVKGQFNEGDIFNFMTKENADYYGISGYDFEAIQNRGMEFHTFTAYLVNDSLTQQVQNWGGYPYAEMTQELYDSYSAAFKAWMGAYKGLYFAVDGATFEEYVAPAIPAWDSYPELSGYVRGTNSLSIKDAVVRLVDADGVNHDIVTDVNGYYKFSKEMFYNSIAFDHGATASSFNMFVLEHTLGSTASLYDSTNIYQNSFFGAENDREMTWSVSVKMGKPARRNFKLEFLPDYSSYPSFSGTILDQDGNPVMNALMEIYHPGLGKKLTERKNGSSILNSSKFTLLGESKSFLTDENGYYEYPSQYVGEWFNGHKTSQGYSEDFNLEAYDTIREFALDYEFNHKNGYLNGLSFYGGQNLALGLNQEVYISNIWWNKQFYYNDNWFNTGFVTKLDSNGVLDEAFSTHTDYTDATFYDSQGRTGQDYSWDPKVIAIGIQSTGKIILTGQFKEQNSGKYCLIRLNTDGTVDETFDSSFYGAMFATNFADWCLENNYGSVTSGDYLYARLPICSDMVIQDDDKIILVGGNIYNPTNGKYGIMRLNADGTIDETFNAGLKINSLDPDGPLSNNRYYMTLKVDLQSDGKILIAGIAGNEQLMHESGTYLSSPSSIIRLNSDGTIDETFIGLPNFDTTNAIGSINEGNYILNLKSLSNGDIVIGGSLNRLYTAEGQYEYCGGLMILNNDGTVKKHLFVDSGDGYTDNINFNQISSFEEVDGYLIVAGEYGIQRIKIDGYQAGSLNFGTESDPIYRYFYFSAYSWGTIVKKYSENSFIALGGFNNFWDNIDGTNNQSMGIVKFDNIDRGIIKPGMELYSINTASYDFSLNSVPVKLNSEGGHIITKDEVIVFANPYIMDRASGQIIDAQDLSNLELPKFYDHRNYFNSKFEFSYYLNAEKPYKFVREIGQSNNYSLLERLDDPEIGAEIVHVTYHIDPTNNYLESRRWIYTQSDTGYVTFVVDGERTVVGDGQFENQFSFQTPEHLTGDINTNRHLYYYSSNKHGAAQGKILYVTLDDSLYSDISECTGIRNLEFNTNFGGELDITGLNDLRSLYINAGTKPLKVIGIDSIPSLQYLNLQGLVYSNESIQPENFEYSLDYQKMYGSNGFRKLLQFDGSNLYTFPVGDKIMVTGEFWTARILEGFTPNNLSINSCNYHSLYLLDSENSANALFDSKKLDGEIRDVKLLSSGKYLIVGGFSNYYVPETNEYLATNLKGLLVLDEHGNVDSTFNCTHSHNFSPKKAIVTSDSKILVFSENCDILKLDFSGLELQYASLSSTMTYTYDIVEMPNGKFLVGGSRVQFHLDGSSQGQLLSMLNSDLTIDTSFSLSYADFTDTLANGIDGGGDILCIALQEDGKILVGGNFGFYDNYLDADGNVVWKIFHNLIRFNSDLSLDYNFCNILRGTDYSIQNINGLVRNIAVDADGDIILGGTFDTVKGSARRYICSIKPDGSLSDDKLTYCGAEPKNIYLYNNNLVVGFSQNQAVKKEYSENYNNYIYGYFTSLKKIVKSEKMFNISSPVISYIGCTYLATDKLNVFTVQGNTINNIDIGNSEIKSFNLNGYACNYLRCNSASLLVSLLGCQSVNTIEMWYAPSIKPQMVSDILSGNTGIQTLKYYYGGSDMSQYSDLIFDLSSCLNIANLELGGMSFQNLILPTTRQIELRLFGIRNYTFDFGMMPSNVRLLYLSYVPFSNLGSLPSNSILNDLTIRNAYNGGQSLDFSNITSLNYLRLGDINITDGNSINVSNLANLRYLDLSWINGNFNFICDNTGTNDLRLYIDSCRMITSLNLSGLRNITSGQEFKISYNNALTSLTIGANQRKFSQIYINNNPYLDITTVPMQNFVSNITNYIWIQYNKSVNIDSIFNNLAPLLPQRWGALRYGGMPSTSASLTARNTINSRGWNLWNW